MELKDKLKKLRQDKGMTQAQLAEALFVSRSTIAKWENGLGLPSEDSMAALKTLFEVSQEAVATSQPEQVILEKNRKLYWIGQIALWCGIVAILALALIIPMAIQSGTYGLTLEMAASVYADNAYVDTGDYRIYYFQFEGDFDDGRHWSMLQGFRPVEKHIWGYTISEEDYTYRVFTQDNYVVGSLVTIKGKHGYYNLIKKAMIYQAQEDPDQPLLWDIPESLITATSIFIGGKEYPLEEGFFFITEEPVRYFTIGDLFFDVT